MKTVYDSIKRMKENVEEYLKSGNFDDAIRLYRILGDTKKAARLSACLEKTMGDKEAACDKYLRSQSIKKLFIDFPMFIGLGVIEGALIGLCFNPTIDHNKHLLTPNSSSAYVEQIPVCEDESSSAPFGAAVGGLLGLYFAAGKLYDERRPEGYRAHRNEI